MSEAVRKELHDVALVKLSERLHELTDPQRELFGRVYPRITPDNIVSAIDLCDRTIRKNLAGRVTATKVR